MIVVASRKLVRNRDSITDSKRSRCEQEYSLVFDDRFQFLDLLDDNLTNREAKWI